MDTVIYDASCGVCNRARETVEALDWLRTMRWVPSTSVEAAVFAIPRQHLDHAVHIVRGDRVDAGYSAVQQIAARLPLTWLVAATVITKKPWTALLFAFLFSPLAVPLGQPAYDWAAGNRYRISGATCDIVPAASRDIIGS